MTRESRFAGARDASAPRRYPVGPSGFPTGIFYMVAQDDDGHHVEVPVAVEGFPYFTVQTPEVV